MGRGAGRGRVRNSRQRGRNRPCTTVQPGTVDLTADPEIEEIAPSSNRVCGDDIRLQREVSDSFLLSPENVDVTNIDSVLRIPFDYEALMQESSENESNIFSSHERDTDSNQGDHPYTVVTSHNTTTGVLTMQDHTSLSQSADDALSDQNDAEDTSKLEENNVPSHNKVDEINNNDESHDSDDLEQSSIHPILVENTDIKVSENKTENNISHNINPEIQSSTSTTNNCKNDDNNDNSNIMLDSNDDTNIDIVQELLQTVLSTVEDKLIEERELSEKEIKDGDLSATNNKMEINIISVAPGDDGVQINKTEKVSVEQTYDKEALINALNCCVKLRRLDKQDIALWKPMPKPLNAEINTFQPSTANNTRRNPKRKAKDSIDYILCQNDDDDSQSENDNNEEFKLVEPLKPLRNLRNPSKDRIKAQEQIAMKKAALALLSLRKAHGGGVGMVDKDLKDICDGTTGKKLDEYEQEYEHLIKKIDLSESEDTQHNAIPSHNSSGNTSHSEEFSATTHAGPIDDSLLPVITNNRDTENQSNNKELPQEFVSDDNEEDDNTIEYKSVNSDNESSTPEENQTTTTKSRNVVTNNTYNTEDIDGNRGELNIKCVARKKYRRTRKYTCSCGSIFSSQKKINEHYVEEHGMLRCSTCGKPFRTPAAHRKHQYEHLPKQFKCNKCDKEYAFQSQLDSHKISHRDQATFKCMHKKCDKWFKNKGALTRHVKKHDGKTLCCKFCDYTATAIENLNGHMMKHNKLKRYVCLYCGKGFRWSQERIRHYKNCTKYPSN